MCRTVCRRAERRTIACGDEVSAECVRYLNRLSDLLFILSRAANVGAGRERAAVAAGSLPAVTDAGLYPAEHRALRELSAFSRQLVGHWERLGDRLGEPLLRDGRGDDARADRRADRPLRRIRDRAVPGLAGRRRHRRRGCAA